jgi:HSP20 family protein
LIGDAEHLSRSSAIDPHTLHFGSRDLVPYLVGQEEPVMNLMHWRARPINPFFDLQQEINRMFEQFDGGNREEIIRPALDIKDEDKMLVVTAELPGVDSKDVEISIQDNVLIVKGEKRSQREETKDTYRCVERSFGSFERRVQLPNDVDSEKAEASMDNGVLTLRLPKLESASARTIPIKARAEQGSLPKPGQESGQSQRSQGQTQARLS